MLLCFLIPFRVNSFVQIWTGPYYDLSLLGIKMQKGILMCSNILMNTLYTITNCENLIWDSWWMQQRHVAYSNISSYILPWRVVRRTFLVLENEITSSSMSNPINIMHAFQLKNSLEKCNLKRIWTYITCKLHVIKINNPVPCLLKTGRYVCAGFQHSVIFFGSNQRVLVE